MTLVEVRNLTKHYRPSRLWQLAGSKVTKAVEDVSFTIEEGTVFGLVGESGCGKSTLGRLILRLIEPTAGEIYFQGRDITRFSQAELKQYRRNAQIIFQNPYSALNPRRTIEESLSVGYEVYGIAKGKAKRDKLVALLEQVGLGVEVLNRYPHQFSGGQRQRLVIARALTVEPRFIVADEPVSMLDVSIQAQVLNLLRELQKSYKFTLMLITHDLRVVRHMCDRVGVMYLGRMMELAPKPSLYAQPIHPYTNALMAAAPDTDVERAFTESAIAGEVWDKAPPPDGCVFYNRCPLATADCQKIVPSFEMKAPDHAAACWRVGERYELPTR
jgi:oligopeptide/dipeptide ABC transporter ATP-binding protein